MTPEAIAALLQKRMSVEVDSALAGKLARYLQLLMLWNTRTNLSAIRDPEAIVLRHFGESLQCARALPPETVTLLDYGSGAGFPGAICALAKPSLHVTLAESQNKKAAFLFELCRHVPLSAKVHVGRVESLPTSRLFDVVTLRAVDRMELACMSACKRVRPDGWLVIMTTTEDAAMLAQRIKPMECRPSIYLRGTEKSVILLAHMLAI